MDGERERVRVREYVKGEEVEEMIVRRGEEE